MRTSVGLVLWKCKECYCHTLTEWLFTFSVVLFHCLLIEKIAFMCFKSSKVLVNGKQWIRGCGVITSALRNTWRLLKGTILSQSLYKYCNTVLWALVFELFLINLIESGKAINYLKLVILYENCIRNCQKLSFHYMEKRFLKKKWQWIKVW